MLLNVTAGRTAAPPSFESMQTCPDPRVSYTLAMKLKLRNRTIHAIRICFMVNRRKMWKVVTLAASKDRSAVCL